MIKYCLFDLDGTLLYTLPSIAYYVNKALADNGVEQITLDEARRFICNGSEKLIERIFLSKGISDPVLQKKVLKEYKSAYDREPLYLTEYYPGIVELISELGEKGIKLCVLSNKPDVAVRGLISHFFGEIKYVRGARVGVPLKPDPTAGIELLSEMGATPEQTAVIGDSPEDIMTAKNLGAALKIGVSWGFRSKKELKEAGADVICDSPGEVFREVLDAD